MADSSSSNSKRRRGLGIVTPNACTECRKKRAKCDGQTPCGRCVSQKGVECVYEVPVRQSKEHMRSEIEHLREQQRQNEQVLTALKSNTQSEEVLNQLRDGVTLETITGQLERMGSISSSSAGNHTTTFSQHSDHQAIENALQAARNIRPANPSTVSLRDVHGMDIQSSTQHMGNVWSKWSSESPVQDEGSQDGSMNWSPDSVPFSHQNLNYPLVGTWSEPVTGQSPNSSVQFARGQGQETLLGQAFGIDHNREPVINTQFTGSWTSITSDRALVEHLMALYFCWEYPTFASLSKEHFLEDFKTGNQQYCSSLLVNCILSLGCRFSEQPHTRTAADDSDTAGDQFFVEAVRLLEAQPDRHNLTTIQSLGLMSIREASCGRSSQSIFYSGQSIRLAMEMGLHLDPEEDISTDAQIVRSATFWGAFSLDQAWCLSIGRLPQFSRDPKLLTKPAIIDAFEASDWIPYTDDGAPLERSCTQPSNVRSVFKTFCELSEIVHKSLYTLYSPGGPVTGKKLLDAYNLFINWYDGIPTALRLGHNFTPAVLFAHMYYHFAILLLFRPFIKVEIVASSLSPRDICSQAANAITTLVRSYSHLYTLRRTPSFVPYFVLTSAITHAVTLGTSRAGPEQLIQGLEDLKEMRGAHGFANRGIDILHYLINHWEVGNSQDFPPDESKEMGDYKTLCLPSSTSMNHFCPHISGNDVINGIGPVAQDQNPLFWPFPFQGKPMMETGTKLESAGFRVIP